MSGSSNSSAYQILTPAGTIGVRGTAFDFYVGPDGTTAVVLLNGAARFCGPGGCRQLQQRCDCVVAKPNGNMSAARRVDPSILDTLGNPRALPFLSGNQRLSGGIGMIGGCNMASVAPERKDRKPPPAIAPVPPRQDPPQRQAEPQKERPNKPDMPHHDRPDRPDKHDGHDDHDRPGNHDQHHGNDQDHQEHDRDHDGGRDHDRDRHHDRSWGFNRNR
ncbi:hypothetical protein JOH51_001148 [Rhizobium leguminosarum]|nr:hypothetical protein [Rhizobium leguminosarum]